MSISDKRRYFIVYTVLFVALFISCFGLYLLLYKKTFFRRYDGFDQHYISFLYLGKWGRSIVRNLFINHKFLVPLWNQAIGYGADVPTSFAAYLWDPFNWISFFIPARYAETGYAVMIIMKFYACGVAYSIFAFHRKHQPYAVLCGTVIYTFSAVNYVGFYQSFFINPLIIFPLLIMGVDILFDEKKSAWYVVMLAISFASYFYFAYMMCILVLFYCIIRLVFSSTVQKTAKNIMQIILRFLLYSLVAAGISAVSLIPSLIVMLQAGRIGLPHYLPLWFHKSYYSGIVSGWTTSFNMLGRDCNIGWGVIAFVCVIVLFLYQSKYWQVKTEFILMTAGLCIPMFGHIMNGMSYTANRWVWAYDLLVALIATMMIPKLKELSVIQWVVLLISSVLYIIVCHGYFKVEGESMDTAAILILLIVVLCCVFSKITEKQFRIITVFISGVCVVCMSLFTYSRDYGNGFDNHIDAGKAYSSMLASGGLPLLNDLDTSDGTRFDRYGLGAISNATWLYGVSGINFYISVYNNNIDLFHSAIAMNTGSPTCYAYSGLDRRSELEALLGVNHYFVNGNNISKPVGFDQLEAQEDIYGTSAQSYRADSGNSLFYTFDRKISYSEFNKLSPYEKQQVLMQACVVDDSNSNSFVNDLNVNSENIPFTLTPYDGVTINDNTIIVSNDGGQVEITFSDQNAAEIYLYLDMISYENEEATSYYVSTQGYHDDEQINNLADSFSGYTWYSHMYGQKLNWLLNLGTSDQSVNKIVITFGNAGTYSMKDMKLYARPVGEIQQNVSKLQRTASDVGFSNNRYHCDANLTKAQTLFASIPYSDGWTVYDNGKQLDVHKTDVAFMSFDLDAGEHHIEMVYRTPGLYKGLLITICVIVFYILLQKRNKIGKKLRRG